MAPEVEDVWKSPDFARKALYFVSTGGRPYSTAKSPELERRAVDRGLVSWCDEVSQTGKEGS